MPFSGYALDGDSMFEMMTPPVRSVEYHLAELDQDRAMMTVTKLIRDAWRLLPCACDDTDENHRLVRVDPKTVEESNEFIKRYLGPYSRLTSEEQAALPANPDLTTLVTPWRQTCYDYLCHVFVDTYPFLGESGGTERYGHYHHPTQEVVTVADGEPETRCYKDRNVMLLPVYMAPGVVVKILVKNKEGNFVEKEQCDIVERPYQTWWVRSGVQFQLVFERKGEEGPFDGHAAVFLFGPACDKGSWRFDEIMESSDYPEQPSGIAEQFDSKGSGTDLEAVSSYGQGR